MVDVGNTISANDVNGVAVITQVMPMDVVFAVPQDRVSDVLGAAKTDMQVIAMDRTRTGVLGSGTFASLDNQIDTTTGTVKAKARFANADSALFANQFVNIQLRIRSIDNAVIVPVTAVRLGGTGDYVFVLNPAERTVSVRPVTRGQAAGEKIVIASGLKAGEQVITEGADRLKEGSRVSLAGDAPRGGGRRQGASAPQGATSAAAPGPAVTAASAMPQRAAPDNAAPAAPPSTPPVAAAPSAKAAGPSAEQRQRMLEQVKDNPEALERRKKFLEKLDSGDAEALERWQGMQQRMQQGGGQGRERPPQ
jgi:multidrug efflux system membrane fusion protein